ncbi:hypothetical protein [Streptomyces sp. CA-146814]
MLALATLPAPHRPGIRCAADRARAGTGERTPTPDREPLVHHWV